MTDRNIKRVALVVIGALAGVCGMLAARFNSIMWAVIAAWLVFALVVETWPRRDA